MRIINIIFPLLIITIHIGCDPFANSFPNKSDAKMYKADNIDIDYTLSAFMKINDYLSTTLVIQCLYDDNAIKRVQLREVFGLAFIMDITEIPKIL